MNIKRVKPRSRTLKIEDAALEVMKESGAKHCWYGDPDLVAEIADRAGCKHGHPLNRSASVMRALALSNKFRRSGYIEHQGRRYNLYEIYDQRWKQQCVCGAYLPKPKPESMTRQCKKCMQVYEVPR